MATSLPYLPSYKNVEKLFLGIAAAKVPESFTQSFLAQTLGLKASGDRPLIPLMRTLGFIDAAGRPTPEYRLLKNPAAARGAIADAIRKAYAPLFAAHEGANSLSTEQLRGLISQVAGTDEEMTKRIAYTFSALAKNANFNTSGSQQVSSPSGSIEAGDDLEEEEGETTEIKIRRPRATGAGLRTEFHYNLQIHLPANGTEETYLNIFNSLRKVFQ
ncbi:DUF5343 domain-containing protein [Novilysobacter luteus]|uniref:DUF5343 domain-containing protein n=1 Tax=Novilysobacter luteus TaxID=2822368 RepID=UPI001BFCCB12|nr:DUF5343 domain-containing protein [Lysobacter luteus]